MTDNIIKIIFKGQGEDLNNVIAGIKNQIPKIADVIKSTATRANSGLNTVYDRVFSLKSAILSVFTAIGIKKLSADFLSVGESVDRMKLSLDAVTAGNGNAWFNELNQWAMKNHVNIDKTVQAFIRMRNLGLNPTIKDMETLNDTTRSLGGKDEVFESIASALGQMHAKGKVSSEDLMHLVKQGIPAYDILKEKLGLTADQLENMGAAGISADATIRALMSGMAERFGGQSDKIKWKYSGLMEALKGYWFDFKRLVMESGVMKSVETGLAAIVRQIDALKASGKFDQYAVQTAKTVRDAIAGILEAAGWMPSIFFTVKGAINDCLTMTAAWAHAITNVAIGLSLLHPKNLVTMMEATGTFEERLRKASPTLMEFRDIIDEVGESNAAAAKDSNKHAEKLAELGVKMESVANKIRNTKIELPKSTESPSSNKSDTSVTDTAISAGMIFSIKRDLMQKTNQLTMSELDYKKWALDAELAELKVKIGGHEELLNLATDYEIAKREELRKAKADIDLKEEQEQIKFRQDLANKTDQINLSLYENENQRAQLSYENQKNLLNQEESDLRIKAGNDLASLAEVVEWKKAKLQELEDAHSESLYNQYMKEHEVMASLAQSWGLTWEEVRAGSVNCWQDIGQAMSGITQNIGSNITAVLTGTKKAKAAGKDILQSIASATISTLLQIMMQNLILAGVQKGIVSGQTAMVVAANKAITASAMPAAIAESIASWGGAAAAGAAAFAGAMGSMTGMGMATVATFAAIGGATKAAKGGIFDKPTLTLFGEEGAEAVIPLSSGRRTEARKILEQIVPMIMPDISQPVGAGSKPAQNSAQISGGGNVYVNLNFSGPVNLDPDMSEIERKIGRAVSNAIRGS